VKPDDTVAIPFLIVVLLYVPALGVFSWYQLKKGKSVAPKRRAYPATIALLCGILLYSMAAASHEKIVLFPYKFPSSAEWLAGGVFVAVLLLRVRFGWHRIDVERKQRLKAILPENPIEFRYWIAISLLAGLGEECAYRGVSYSLLQSMTGSVAGALAVCVIAFGAAHMTYGWKGAASTALLGLVFHMMVFVTGTLYLAIAAHAVYDLLVGRLVMRLLLRNKFEEAQLDQTEAAS
jgi:membrane protease YdiL (CAAX protease family)